MTGADEKIRERLAAAVENKAILKAFRFLEDVERQVEALRRSIMEQLKQHDVFAEGMRIGNVKKDGCKGADTDGGWLFRSSLDTFEIFRKSGKRPAYYGAIQVSLAPHRERADSMFFPHVAVIIYSANLFDNNAGWGAAESEFILDDDFLYDRDKFQEGIWKLDQSNSWQNIIRWGDEDDSDDCSAFVVPLLDLKDESDVRSKIVDPLTREITRFLGKKIEACVSR